MNTLDLEQPYEDFSKVRTGYGITLTNSYGRVTSLYFKSAYDFVFGGNFAVRIV